MVPRVVGSNPISHPPNKPRTQVRGFLFGNKPKPIRKFERTAFPKKKAPPPHRGEGKLVVVGLPPPSFLRRGLAAGANIPLITQPPSHTALRTLCVAIAMASRIKFFMMFLIEFNLECIEPNTHFPPQRCRQGLFAKW